MRAAHIQFNHTTEGAGWRMRYEFTPPAPLGMWKQTSHALKPSYACQLGRGGNGLRDALLHICVRPFRRYRSEGLGTAKKYGLEKTIQETAGHGWIHHDRAERGGDHHDGDHGLCRSPHATDSVPLSF